ncbi:hypothetical protein BA1DRAFT_02354 [Photorhabdus aegyptia]|uniref:Uncharacterized protein n=1 Tax=Photorhabdus aegyptia TaxID=2805098 RepID=A0A022PHS6_9GAMM|nr:hypothetical protein BA1DRAFT_02354 [Photorhabdus aegyptia]
MTTEKRETGTEYGQEKLRERSAQSEVNTDENSGNKKVATKKMPGIIIAAILAGSVTGTIMLTGDKTPNQQVNDAVIELNKDGINVDDVPDLHNEQATPLSIADDLNASVSTDQGKGVPVDEPNSASANENEKTEGNFESQLVEPEEKTNNANVDENWQIKPSDTPVSADDANTVKPGYTDGSEEAITINTPTPVTDVVPSNEVVKSTTQSKSESTVSTGSIRPSDNSKTESGTVASNKPAGRLNYDLAKFGITEDSQATIKLDIKPANQTPELPFRRTEFLHKPLYGQMQDMLTGADLNYTGKSVKVEYNQQQQNTVYVYSTFAAKIFLLPLGRNDNVNAYLSDENGWKLSMLPNNIIRVHRAENKGSWSQATDLFIVAGDRTYSLILQAVGDPEKRTDILRFFTPETVIKKKD